jgi:hypothetical protein
MIMDFKKKDKFLVKREGTSEKGMGRGRWNREGRELLKEEEISISSRENQMSKKKGLTPDPPSYLMMP